MNWDDEGYLISKIKYNENSMIAEFFTKNHGKSSGIIFGASSKKIKNYLQIGNKFFINYNFKNENRVGYFKLEILSALTPVYFDNKKKLMCIASALNLIKVLTADSQENLNVYNLITNFFSLLEKKFWLKEYILWELQLLKEIGYDLNLGKITTKENSNNKIEYFVQSSNEKKKVPSFLIEKNMQSIDLECLLKGLKLVSDYLDKSIFKPNNISHPISRIDFVNILK
jgi:DNA repair protein RecO (recombination protein O)